MLVPLSRRGEKLNKKLKEVNAMANSFRQNRQRPYHAINGRDCYIPDLAFLAMSGSSIVKAPDGPNSGMNGADQDDVEWSLGLVLDEL